MGTQAPDVLLLDPFPPEAAGVKLVPEIRKRSPATKVLILSSLFNRELVFQALLEAANGYLQKTASSSELLKAIRALHAGEAWVERGLMGNLLDHLPGKGDAE